MFAPTRRQAGPLDLLTALLGGVLAYKQAQRQRQDDARVRSREDERFNAWREDRAREAADREEERRMANFRTAVGMVAPKDRPRVAQEYGIKLPEGVQPYDPAEEQVRELMGKSYIQQAPDFENPSALYDLGAATLRGQQLPGRPEMKIGLPGIGLPGGLAIPHTLPAADPVRAAFDRAGRRVQDIRDERNQQQALELRQQDLRKAQETEAERTRRALEVARLQADSAATVAGIRAGTPEERAYKDTYATVYAKSMADYPGNPNLWDELAHRAATGATKRFSERSGAGYEPFPDFTAKLPMSLGERKLNLMGRGLDIREDQGNRRLDLQGQRNGVLARQGDRRLDQGDRRLELDQQREGRLREQSQRQWQQSNAAAPKMSDADKQELIRIRGQIGRIEASLNAAHAKNDRTGDAQGFPALERLLAQEKTVLDRYRGGAAPNGAVGAAWGANGDLKARRIFHFEQFRKSNGRAPNAKEMNIISRMVEDGRLK